MIEFYNVENVTLFDKNLFANNTINVKQPKSLIKCKNASLAIINNAYSIIESNNYVIMREYAIINITQNVAVTFKITEAETPALIIFNNQSSNERLCMFESYLSHQESLQTERRLINCFAIVFNDNQNYGVAARDRNDSITQSIVIYRILVVHVDSTNK